MTPRRTTTTYAILGLLGVRSWTTYELAKQVQRSLKWFWPRAERKLYDEPKRLVADGLATATKETTGKRPRTVYGITEAGREELRRWLDEPPAPPTIEFEGLVKIFFAEAGSLDQLNATLDAIAAEASDRLEALAVMADVRRRVPELPGAAARRRAADAAQPRARGDRAALGGVGAGAGGELDGRRRPGGVGRSGRADRAGGGRAVRVAG